jgi:hydroxyacylglutathione hydrolase
MKQISRGVYFVEGRDEMIPDAHVYILGEPSSGDLTLVDAGLVGKGSYKIHGIKELRIEPAEIKRVIMTHTHMDHIGCLPEILEQVPAAEVWIHKEEAAPLEEGDERTVYGMEMFRGLCQSQFGLKPGAFTRKADRELQGGEELEIGGMLWEVIHIPGHSPGSIALYHRPGKILIPGDTVYADHSIGRFDLHRASAGDLRRSLLRLSELEVEILLPGHNRIVEHLPPGYIAETARQWEPYLR